ncbi:MAG TPA: ATP-dependent helicase HrpB [Cyclobacteriaceae bacterium]|nr:ATP-dependent helicase HrpB [Cyclobacteriaceae bacterium]
MQILHSELPLPLMQYPVQDILPPLKASLAVNKKVILQAPPGAGKSTIVPLELMDEPWLNEKKIIMLEPRRLAARSVAMRMASLLEDEVGKKIGYRVRFENKVSNQTRIEVVTEGILTRMIQRDNALEDVGLVIFDEFHERSLQADLALALCLQTQHVLRDDLRILIMSATLDGQALSEKLTAPLISSEGKQYPVEVRYLGDEKDVYTSVYMARAIRKAMQEEMGDVLAFFPGTGEIKRTLELLEQENISALLFPLYGDLPFKKQQEAILPDPQGRRKVVLATSIAETSLTIEGIHVVIDSGLSRIPKFDPRSGLTRLETVRVTRDAADQRTGRAGRLESGVCYRLWSEATQRNLQPNRKPEILEADLSSLVLELAAWGITDINELVCITPPPAGAVSQAKELLTQLGALEDGRVTKHGRAMAELPTHPRIAHMLVSHTDEPALAADVAALLEERDPINISGSADLTLRLEVLRKWRSKEYVQADRNVLERIERLAQSWRKSFSVQVDNKIVSDFEVGRLLALAYPDRIAKRMEKHNERYKLMNGRVAKLPAHDPLMHAEWIVVAQLDAGSGEGKIFLAAPVHEEDLKFIAKAVQEIRLNKERGVVEGVEEWRIGNLVLSQKKLNSIPDDKRISVLCNAIRESGISVFEFSEPVRELQARVNSLKVWRKDEAWPDLSDEYLLNHVHDWLPPFLNQVNSLSELQKLDWYSILLTLVPWERQQKLDALAPARLEVPSGSMIKIQYSSNGQPPVMEVRLQECFGLPDTPAVNEGRVKITMHLLSPGYKPVQVTQDLKSFWNTTYHEVKKELKRRYPKHSWPDDPWTAQAVRGVVRRR